MRMKKMNDGGGQHERSYTGCIARCVVSLGTTVSSGSILLSLVVSATAVRAADWPSWGGQPSRNMASETEKGLPDWFLSGKKMAHGEIDLSTTKNIKWVADLGNRSYGSPVVSQGKVFIGTAGDSSADAALVCLDEKTGRAVREIHLRFFAHR